LPRGGPRLSHVDAATGEARMVDVGAKPVTLREAVASGRVLISREAMRLVREGAIKKGDPLQVARLAGILGAKQTSTLIPLCHPLPLSGIDVTLTLRTDGIAIEARVSTYAQTGVEMEALTAVSIAGLTIYDMVKAVDKAMTITDVRLLEKRGGQSGDYKAAAAAGDPPASASRTSRSTPSGGAVSGSGSAGVSGPRGANAPRSDVVRAPGSTASPRRSTVSAPRSTVDAPGSEPATRRRVNRSPNSRRSPTTEHGQVPGGGVPRGGIPRGRDGTPRSRRGGT
jgi:cyclic pyranopterin phosphate synthase